MDNLTTQLEHAKKIAKTAGDFLVAYKDSKVVKDEGKDIKLTADTEAEKIIIDYLQKNSDIPILSEEAGEVAGQRSELKWIVDPLDGSLNYSRKLPLCCVSIGLWKGSQPLLGVVYDFNNNEMFSGIVDKGSWLNEQPIKVSNVSDYAKAILVMGFPSWGNYTKEGLADFIENLQDYKKVRLIGSAALSLAYVACGRVDAYTERGINLWDIAGGVAIILGAGGKIKYNKDMGKNTVDILINNGLLKSK